MIDEVIDEELVRRTIEAALVLSGVLPLAALAGAITLRFAGRVPGRRWGSLFVFGWGGQVGSLVTVSGDVPIMRVAGIAIIGLATIAFLWRSRRVQAGSFLLGAALPWTLVWGYYAALLVLADAAIEPFQTWTLFAAGLVPALIGLGLMAAGDPLPPEPSPSNPPGQPGSRRIGIVAKAVTAPDSLGPVPISEVASLAAAAVAVIAVGQLGLPGALEPLVQVALGTLAAAEGRLLIRPRPARDAFEAFSWLGEWEMERARAITGGRPLPTALPLAERWLAEVPDDPRSRWIRVEILCWLERLDEARQVAERMPDETAYDRFERAHAFDLIDWMAGGEGDPAALRAAAAELRPGDEDTALRAEVVVALRETARRTAASGVDGAAAPLVAVRGRLGSRADGQLRRALWRRTLPISAITAVVVVILVGTSFG